MDISLGLTAVESGDSHNARNEQVSEKCGAIVPRRSIPPFLFKFVSCDYFVVLDSLNTGRNLCVNLRTLHDDVMFSFMASMALTSFKLVE